MGHNQLRALLAMLLAMSTAVTTSVTALAKSYDVNISDGDVAVHDNGVKQDDADVTERDDGSDSINVNVSGSSEKHNITVDTYGETDVNITLDDVTIDMSDNNKAAIDIEGDSNVNIELKGDNELTGGSGHAAIEVETNKEYTTDETTGVVSGEIVSTGSVTIEGDGTLNAQGGSNAAGIGGGADDDAGNVHITGDVTVNATGGNGGAGIGSGSNKDHPYVEAWADNDGSVTINGNATVNATGTGSGAGIGGGNHQDGGTVVIGGDSTVTAQGGAAGIGSGTGSSIDQLSKTYDNASYGEGLNYDGGNIHITDNAKVEAVGGGGSAGIGGGLYANSGTIVIDGNAVVEATGNNRGAGIGGGYQGDAETITIGGNAVVTAIGGGSEGDAYEAGEREGAAGIGGGAECRINSSSDAVRGGSAGTITLKDNAAVTAVGGIAAAGIGSGSDVTQARRDKDGRDYQSGIKQGSIQIGENVKVEAYADGVKWAIDIDHADVVSEQLILQGRWLQTVLDEKQNNLTLWYDGKEVRTLTGLPNYNHSLEGENNYLSFAADVKQAGDYYLTVADRYDPHTGASFEAYVDSLGENEFFALHVGKETAAKLLSSYDFLHLAERPPEPPTPPTPPVDPDVPTPPVNPTPPSGGNSGGASSNEDDDRDNGTVVIPEGQVLQGTVTIADEEVPLAGLPENAPITILDPQVPLGNLPTTGSNALKLTGLGLVAAAVGAFFGRKKKDQ